jgi:glycosyltransferase involved in cell wall biosynthesis
VAARSGIVRRIAGRAARGSGGGWGALQARVGGVPPAGEIRVSYGHSKLPTSTERAVGGIVKLQSLAKRYPNTRRRFNILYLVSSRLPEAPVLLARAARAKGAAVVVNQNGVAYPGWSGRGWKRINAPMTALLRAASHVFYQSEFCRLAADEFLGVQPTQWEVLHNAVDTARFSPARTVIDRPLTLLLGGTQYARYRVEVALRTLAQVRRSVPDARLIVAGTLRWPSERTPRADADRLATQLSIQDAVDFIGPYTQAGAVEIYRRADLLLHTKYNDPCPTVVIEALACGLPVVYSRSGGVPELVGDAAGIGVPTVQTWERDVPPDPEALSHAIITVRRSFANYAAAARQRAVDRFDVIQWMERHARVFERLTA